jgi:hypothetical protein
VGIDATLADQLSFGRRSSNGVRICVRSRIKHQRFGVTQPLRERIDVLDMIVPDRDVVPGELRKQSRVRSVVE